MYKNIKMLNTEPAFLFFSMAPNVPFNFQILSVVDTENSYMGFHIFTRLLQRLLSQGKVFETLTFCKNVSYFK